MKGDKLRWHRFPINNTELCKRWVPALRRGNFVARSATIFCGNHFIISNYLLSNSSKFIENAVPTLFEFLEHLDKKEFTMSSTCKT